jgi:dihydropteroate synthase/dihydroneopterin aldolase
VFTHFPVIMGILNVTPDSFSDGGQFDSVTSAVHAAVYMVAKGANIIDVGGESTRPGAERISLETECERVIPVVEALSAQGIYVSIDTTRSEVAKAAVAAGARMVNDVSGGLADPHMFEVVAGLGVPIILMHWRGPSRTMQENIHYEDVLTEVCSELQTQAKAAHSAGIERGNIILDPGIGFGKEAEHNWVLLRSIDALLEIGYPLLVGVSRKRFLGSLLADVDGKPRDVRSRDIASAVLAAHLLQRGAWGVRVHDVEAATDAYKALCAINPDPAIDSIELLGLREFGYHGVLEHERINGQFFNVDATLGLSISYAAHTDDLADTVNYAEVADTIRARIAGEPVDLIEKLAELIAADCLAFPQVAFAKIRVHKPDAPIEGEFADVIVTRAKFIDP